MKYLIIILLSLNFLNASVVSDYLSNLEKEIKKQEPTYQGFDFKRGEEIFTSKHIGKKGKEISCVSCHGIDLKKESKNFFTGKIIKPLAPQVNKKRFTKVKNIEKWLKRNFNDVYKRKPTLKEKGDVITYIINKEK